MKRPAILTLWVIFALSVASIVGREAHGQFTPPPLDHVSTFAGGGVGDGLSGLSAAMAPQDIWHLPNGDVLIADSQYCRIRKVSDGIVSTIAGGESPVSPCAFSGDSVPALQASFDPDSLAVDSSGAIFVADRDNCRIRKIEAATNIIRTVAGDGTCVSTGQAQPADSSQVGHPTSVALGPGGALFFAEESSCRIRVISAGFVSTVAGDGTCGDSVVGSAATATPLDSPTDVVVDDQGRIYIAESNGCSVRVISSGVLSNFAGGTCGGSLWADGVLAVGSFLNRPRALSIADNGDLYVAWNHCWIARITLGRLYRVVGQTACDTPSRGNNGPAVQAVLGEVNGLFASSMEVLVADTTGCQAHRVDQGSGIIRAIAGAPVCTLGGDGGLATNAALNDPLSLAVDEEGNVYVADSGNCRIRRIAAAGGRITSVAGAGECDSLYVPDGTRATAAPLDQVLDIAVGVQGNVYFVDSSCRIMMIDVGADLIFNVAGIRRDCDDVADGSPGPSTKLDRPQGISFDNEGKLLIAETGACRIRRIGADGMVVTIAGQTSTELFPACGFSGDGGIPTDALLRSPKDIAPQADGSILVADTNNCRIRVVTATTISTIAGSGNCIPSGDEGPALSAGMRPDRIALDDDGRIYFAGNRLLRSIDSLGVHAVGGEDGASCFDDGPAVDRALCNFSTAVNSSTGFGLYGGLLLFPSMTDRVRAITVEADADGDGVLSQDNCPEVANPDQLNYDRDLTSLAAYGRPFDDETWPKSDLLGDACDGDDDNDGIVDAAEGIACPNASAATNALLRDTDGDHVLDGAECALGSDPANQASLPGSPATDTDNDGLSDSFETARAWNPADSDSDDDGLLDGWEFKFYGSDPLRVDSDLDGCRDGKEAASVNADRIVNSGDQGIVASAFGPSTGPRYVPQFDLNRDAIIDSGDMGLLASLLRVTPCT